MEGPLLSPKQTNRFRVEFRTQDEKLSCSDSLAMQSIYVSEFNILKKTSLQKYGIDVERQTVTIVFVDDTQNRVSDALLYLNDFAPFKLVISALSCTDTVLEQFILNDVDIEEIRHSGFSHEARDSVYRAVEFSYHGVDPVTIF